MEFRSIENQKELRLNPENIQKLYWKDMRSLPEIGKIYRIDSGSLHRWMKKEGMKTRSRLSAGLVRRKLRISLGKLHDLYWKEMMTAKDVGKLYGVSYATVLNLMKKYQIPIRTPLQVGLLKTKIPSHEYLYHWYIDERKSINEIAKYLHVSYASVRKWLKKHKIPIRSISEASRKYVRIPFSQDATEKAYLLGFCIGDAYISKRYQSIDIWTTTTHPAMIRLFHILFSKYGHVSEYPKKGTLVYEWSLRCSLDKSFSFLLEKYKKTISDCITKDENTFYSFLAGYMDAEGCWTVMKSHKDGIGIVFEIQSKDIEILEMIKMKLEEFGYHPTSGLKPKCLDSSKSLRFIRLCRSYEISKLAKKLLIYSKHAEKIEKMQFILNIEEESWIKIKPMLIKLRNRIRSNVIECKNKAEAEYNEKQNCGVSQI